MWIFRIGIEFVFDYKIRFFDSKEVHIFVAFANRTDRAGQRIQSVWV